MRSSIRAFSDERYDYYELMQDLGGIVPKGAIFIHDTDDTENGSITEGCLKLCWTPDGNVYFDRTNGICGGTVIFHAQFTKSDMFRKVKSKNTSIAENVINILEKCINDIKECTTN